MLPCSLHLASACYVVVDFAALHKSWADLAHAQVRSPGRPTDGCAGAQDDIAHVVVMPNVTLSKLEGFVADLIASRARAATTAALRIAADARAIRDDELRGTSDDDC